MSNDQKTELSNNLVIEQNGVIVCKKHPRYLGMVKPKIDCPGCWEVFNQRQLLANAAQKNV